MYLHYYYLNKLKDHLIALIPPSVRGKIQLTKIITPVFEKEKVSDIILGLTTLKILQDMRDEILEEYKDNKIRKIKRKHYQRKVEQL